MPGTAEALPSDPDGWVNSFAAGGMLHYAPMSMTALGDQAPPTIDVAKLRALIPGVGTAGLERSEASARPLRGRILKLKLGFNPNSSSVGTTVVVFLWSLVASGAVLAFTSAVLAHRFRRKERAAAAEPLG
jgi:hypothetical protein